MNELLAKYGKFLVAGIAAVGAAMLFSSLGEKDAPKEKEKAEPKGTRVSKVYHVTNIYGQDGAKKANDVVLPEDEEPENEISDPLIVGGSGGARAPILEPEGGSGESDNGGQPPEVNGRSSKRAIGKRDSVKLA